MPSFGKRTPFTEQHLKPFEEVYGESPNGDSDRKEGEYSFNVEDIEVDKTMVKENQGIEDKLAKSRWRCFSRDWINETKGDSLDISWLKDKDSIDAADLPEPDVLAREAKEELQAALSELDELLVALEEVK